MFEPPETLPIHTLSNLHYLIHELSHKSSFIPRTSQLWNSLPPTTFPESYNLSSSKSNINKLDLVSLSTYTFPHFSVFPLSGFCYRPYGLSPTLLTKKKQRGLESSHKFPIIISSKLLGCNRCLPNWGAATSLPPSLLRLFLQKCLTSSFC